MNITSSKIKIINLKNKKINYSLHRSSRIRYLRLTIHLDGSLLVSAPLSMTKRRIESYLLKKSVWILKYLNNKETFKSNLANKELYQKYKEACRSLVKKRLEYFNNFYKFKFQRISIRNQKTRWGSCSKSGNLNFNYRLIFLPQEQSDYIIVHELCHLQELNHSQNFWNLVAQTIPNYLELRRKLKNNSEAYSRLS